MKKLALLAFLISTPVQAETFAEVKPDKKVVLSIWDEGNKAYVEGRYREAAELYVRASWYCGYDEKDIPVTLIFNNAQAKRKANMMSSALLGYRTFVRLAGNHPMVSVAKRWIDYLTAHGVK